MVHCVPCGKDLFVVRPNVRSRIRRESASLSRSRLPVNDNPMEWPIWAGWTEANTGKDNLDSLNEACIVLRECPG